MAVATGKPINEGVKSVSQRPKHLTISSYRRSHSYNYAEISSTYSKAKTKSGDDQSDRHHFYMTRCTCLLRLLTRSLSTPALSQSLRTAPGSYPYQSSWHPFSE